MPGGRPTELTEAVQSRLCSAIAAGNYYQAACRYADIDYSTFLRWMKTGKKARAGKFRQFYSAVTKSKADAEVRIVAQWQQHIPDNWQAARDFLARRFPQRWGPRDKHEVGGPGGTPLVVRVIETVVDGRDPDSSLEPAPGPATLPG